MGTAVCAAGAARGEAVLSLGRIGSVLTGLHLAARAPERVGAVVWLLLPYVEGQTVHDGTGHTTLAVIAEYAEGYGIPVHVCVHHDARGGGFHGQGTVPGRPAGV
jgi:hypothetical protein